MFFQALYVFFTSFFFSSCVRFFDGGVVQSNQLIPREILFGNPQKTGAKVSPDGKRVSYIAPDEGVLNVWIQEKGEDQATVITNDRDRGVRAYFWAENGQQIIYVQDKGGDENWRIYSVDIETKEVKDLTPFDNIQARILDTHKDYPDEMLIALNKENPQIHDVYRLNITTGELLEVAKNPGNFVSWFTDTNFKLRGATAMREDGGTQVFCNVAEGEPFELFAECDFEDNLNPVFISKDGKDLITYDSRGANTTRLVTIDLKTKEMKMIYSDEGYDVSSFILHPDTYEIQAVAVMRDRVAWEFFDQEIKEEFDFLEKLSEGELVLASRSDDDQTWVILFHQDDESAIYYLYDRKTKQSEKLFEQRPELSEYCLAPMESVTFTSRDGLKIEGYITFPPDLERKNLPLVLNVHGGPWVRDGWGYDPEAQWMANRGYICLQINYRGSTGYGKDFLNAGNREWAGKMHDDLIDGVNWAIEKGYADKKKVAIYGGSYGGYAALVGATFTPDVFCCAVDIVGPSNILTLIETIPPYWKPLIAVFHKRVGDPETDKEFLESRSPLFRVDQIQIPILIAQGANDPRVKQSEAEQIVAAMKEKGLPYEYALYEDEGHGFAKPENRIDFYQKAEKFLAKHLGGRYEN